MILRAMLAVAHATGRASHARKVKGDDTDKKGYNGPPGWGFGMGLTTPHSKKPIVTKVEQRKEPDRFNEDEHGTRKRNRYLRTLATWNVRTMLKPGRMKEIMEEIGKAKVDVVTLQEIRWQGQGRIDKKDFTLFYSGPKERTGQYRTGFIISSKMRKFSFF